MIVDVEPVEALGRQREVWTAQEFRLLNRVGNLLHSRGMSFSLSCTADSCRQHGMTLTPGANGGSVLRCQCKDRIFERAF